MSNTRTKTLLQYVIPAILTNTCIFLFTIIDGIFVGNGVGTDSLGADAFYMPMVKEYVFWWALFAIPSALSVNFQCFCRNDGSPMLVMVATIISTVLNIFLDWLFIFPMEMGIMGAALATGISQTVAWLIVLMHFIQKKGDKERKAYFDAKTKIHLMNYIESRTDNNSALFVSLNKPHNRLTESGVELRLREMGKKVGVEKVHPHKFRRTMATRAIEKGMPIEQV